jgi:beta-lactamase regulating signal transducer with metallopeptidase domain
MDRIDGIVLTFVLNALWQVPAAVVVGLAGDRLLRRSPARLRHALWLAVLAVAIGLPVASAWPRHPAAPSAAAPTAAPLPVKTGEAAGWRGALPSEEKQFPAGAAALVAGLWGLSLLAHGLKLGRAGLRANRLVRDAHPLEVPPPLSPAVDRCRTAFGLQGLEILGSPDLAGPVTVGAWRPRVLLPTRFFDSASPDETASALGHELAHVRRRDCAVNLLCETLLLPIAFHPAVRLLRRRLTETREMACDEAVVDGLVRPRIYARSLLSLAAAGAGLPRPSTTLGVLDAHTLEVRMKSILDHRSRVGLPTARALLGAALLLLGGIALAASGVTVRAVAADARGDLRPFVGTWSADWTPEPKDGGNGQKVRVFDLEVHPDGRIVATWYKYLKGGGAPQKEVLLVADYAIEGRTLKYKTHVEKFALPDKPAGPAEFWESLELQGGDDAVWRSLSNSYVDALKKRGEPVPPLPPPTPMKRQP